MYKKQQLKNNIYYLLQWLEKDFLTYLTNWQISIKVRKDVTKAQMGTMCLSRETLEGIRTSGNELFIDGVLVNTYLSLIIFLQCSSLLCRDDSILTQTEWSTLPLL